MAQIEKYSISFQKSIKKYPSKLRFVFLSANESLESGLIQSQFIRPVEELSYSKDIDIIIINIHKPFGKKYKNKLIEVVNLPVLVPFRFVNFTSIFFINEILCFFYALVISFYLKKNDKVCYRAYVPGLIGVWAGKFKKISMIFDPRSLYVHENTNVYFKKDSICCKYWLNVEKRIVKSASKIISVSKGQNDYYFEKYNLINNKCIIIPCYASAFETINNQILNELRNKLNFQENDLVIGYTGSLNNGWNNVELYKKYFKESLKLNYKILIISQDKKKILSDPFFSTKGIHVFSFNDKIGDYNVSVSSIQIADYGIVLLEYTHDWFTRLTVKFVDYTSNGLPVIAHKNVGEAYNLLNVYSLKPSLIVEDINDLNNLRKPNKNERNEIVKWANQYFSINNINKILL
jgi:hypothetical protein